MVRWPCLTKGPQSLKTVTDDRISSTLEKERQAMSIQINNPETERIVRGEIANGYFRSVDDLIAVGVHAWKEINLAAPASAAKEDDQATARRKAGEAIRELRKGVTLDRPEGMSLREYAHIGHKY
jgi:hypothetical protein